MSSVKESIEITDSKGATITLDSREDIFPQTLDAETIVAIKESKELQEKEFCINCKYWKADTYKIIGNEQLALSGQCRLDPPVYCGGAFSFPKVNLFDWCGKYVRKI